MARATWLIKKLDGGADRDWDRVMFRKSAAVGLGFRGFGLLEVSAGPEGADAEHFVFSRELNLGRWYRLWSDIVTRGRFECFYNVRRNYHAR